MASLFNEKLKLQRKVNTAHFSRGSTFMQFYFDAKDTNKKQIKGHSRYI